MVFFSRLSMVFNVCQENIPRFNICHVATFVGSSHAFCKHVYLTGSQPDSVANGVDTSNFQV